ncbi:amidase [Ramlibacter sp. HM2]|uniref:Amidase n=1 Tax=Ramlibacter pallidus TaxID=2780087 RepID=A0ABR9S339_9BURK|nr:amidase family protein [Ramlibacter pallidus]MBE7367859.1 amidase [Ramlibacter pallidus]
MPVQDRRGPPPRHLPERLCRVALHNRGVQEHSIASVHAAYRDGTLTTTALVRHHLARIAAYDRKGPALLALLHVHPQALDEAARLDEVWRTAGPVGPLHGIPIVLKDNFHTHDLPTTCGSTAMRGFRTAADATVVQRLRAAGALVLAKANLQEFARGGVSISSLGGQVRNPYDLGRTAGGSSGGTAAAVAADFAIAGTGSDTGQSIRSPASACNLVGVRPTRGLVSRWGVVPNSLTQDEAGPIARNARDAALMLDAMAGYDPRDPVTALGRGHRPASFAEGLEANALQGARIGVLQDLCGREARHAPVNAVIEGVIATMQAQGATVLRLELPGLDALLAGVSTERWEARIALERYFAEFGAGQPVSSFEQVLAARSAPAPIQRALDADYAVHDGLRDPEYLQRLARRDTLRVRLAAAMAEEGLDALLYPLQKILPVPLGLDDQPERNGALSHGTGFPAVCFPGGFSPPTAQAPLGVPVGAELIGPDFSEARLLALAHAFEQAARVRRPPPSTPDLPAAAGHTSAA